jgi:hypothetical protein
LDGVGEDGDFFGGVAALESEDYYAGEYGMDGDGGVEVGDLA